jgi:hypothetical protein
VIPKTALLQEAEAAPTPPLMEMVDGRAWEPDQLVKAEATPTPLVMEIVDGRAWEPDLLFTWERVS